MKAVKPYPFMFVIQEHNEDWVCRSCSVVADFQEASPEYFDKPFLECPKCHNRAWYEGDPRE